MNNGHHFDENKVREVIIDSGFTPGELITKDSSQ